MLLLFTLTEGKHYSHLIKWLCFPIFYYQQLKVKKGKVNKNERYGVKMISISELTGEAYDDENMVHFKNYVQSTVEKPKAKRAVKKDEEKIKIIQKIFNFLLTNGFDNATIINEQREITFGDYSLTLTKHRKKER